MSYAATVGSYKKAITEMLPVIEIYYAYHDALAELSVYRKYLDFSDIIYLDLEYSLAAVNKTGNIYVHKDGALIYSDNVGGGTSKNVFYTLTVPVVNRKYGLCEITLNITGGTPGHVTTALKAFRREP